MQRRCLHHPGQSSIGLPSQSTRRRPCTQSGSGCEPRYQFAAAIDDVYYAGLDDSTEGLNVVSLQELITHVHTTYVTISQPEIDDSMAEFHTAINATFSLAV
jgi:hypothetical protein